MPAVAPNPMWVVIGAVAIFFILYLPFALLSRLYQKVGPNQVLVRSGGLGGVKLTRGGGVLVIPLIHKAERFSLEIMTIEFITDEIPTKPGVPVIIDAVAQVKVRSDTEDCIMSAAERFLSKEPDEIREIIKQTLEGHIRAIVGKMTVEEFITQREVFANRVREDSVMELQNMGLSIDSFSIKGIKDNRGYIAALGVPDTARVTAEADASKAEKDRDARVRKAEAERQAVEAEAIAKKQANIAVFVANKETSIAKIQADNEVALKDRDYKVNLAEYAKMTNARQAEADQAYKIQENITLQKVKEEEVKVYIIQKQKEVEMQEQEILRREKELEATIKKPAEAERYRIETLAEAEKLRLTKTAEGQAESIKRSGFAEADVKKATGIAEAEAQRARGLAQAEVVKATGMSEAEAMTRKAQAWGGYNEAAILQLFMERMPEIARAVSEPLSKTDRIVMVSSDGPGASRLTRDITGVLAELPPVLEALTGVKLSELAKKIPHLGEKGAPGEVGGGGQSGGEKETVKHL